MNWIKGLLLLAVLAVGHKWWQNNKVESPTGSLAVAASAQGFVPLPTPAGASAAKVLIFAPANCSSDAARRADELASELAARGIPHARLQHAEFDSPDRESAMAVERVMQGQVPIVLVRGRGKANPSPAEVLAEYAAGH